MDSILGDIRDQIVGHIEDGVTDSAGDQHMRVEGIYTEDEFEIAEYVADNERRIGRIPHAFVYVGSAAFAAQDSTRRLQRLEVAARTFVATRNTSTNNQQAQQRTGSKWSIYVASSLAGRSVQSVGTSVAYLEDVSVEAIANTERSALWEVRVSIPLNVSTDDILSEIENE